MQKCSCVFCPLFCYNDIRWSGSFVLQINKQQNQRKVSRKHLNFQVLTEKTKWGSVRKTQCLYFTNVSLSYGAVWGKCRTAKSSAMFRSRTITKTVKTLGKKSHKGPFCLSSMFFIVLPFRRSYSWFYYFFIHKTKAPKTSHVWPRC